MTDPNVYNPGDTVEILYTIMDGNGAPYDPPTVEFHYKDSQGTLHTKTVGSDSAATKTADGHYQLVIPIPYTNDSAGDWCYDSEALDGSGNSLDVQYGVFVVRRLATLE